MPIQEVDIGLAADVGTLQRFPKVCGNDSRVRELVLTGRDFDSQEALKIGFLSEVVSGGLEEVTSMLPFGRHEVLKLFLRGSPQACQIHCIKESDGYH
jgi:enoyl-CoA hydratase/carnithine racemase